MDRLLYQFGCINQSLSQLEAAQLRLPAFGRVEVLPCAGECCVCVSKCVFMCCIDSKPVTTDSC